MADWNTQQINGMQYLVLLPDGYDPSRQYSETLYLHQLDQGSYGAQNLENQINPWFNNTGNQSIIVAPLLDQSADPSGTTINFGGISTQDTAGEDNAIAAAQQVMAQYSVDPSRVYLTGNSMGGIGTEDMMIKYNAYTGTEGKLFAAGLSLAGADYGQGFPTPNAAVVQGLRDVPFWAIHGGQDTQVPIDFDQNLYAAEQAIGGKMIFTQDNSLGHDVWDQYYGEGNGPGTPLGWLDSQSTNQATPTPAAPPAATPPPAAPPAAATGTAANSPPPAPNVPAPSSTPTSTGGPDTLIIGAAGYAVGNVTPQFIASVDGNQVGGVNTVQAVEFDGSSTGGNENFSFAGNWGPGPHTVGIDYINNNVSPTGDTGNIFVNSVTYGGNTTTEYSPGGVQAGFLYQNGTTNLAI